MKIIQPFSIARLPRIEFGRGAFGKLPKLISQYGNRVLLVTVVAGNGLLGLAAHRAQGT